MKKTILNLIAILFISSLAFANTVEIDNKFELNTITAVVNNNNVTEYDYWFCYRIWVEEEEDLMTGDIIVTETYKCIWVNM